MSRDLESLAGGAEPRRFADDVMLAYRDTTIGYGRTEIVHVPLLDVRAGEVVGLIGPNGAGKSTMLKAVTGAADVFDGGIDVAGRALAELTAQQRARLVGVVPQQVSVAFALPALDFVEMGRNPHLGRFEQPTVRDRAIAEEAMRRTDTARLADRAVDELSGGDLQRLALAQALAQEPRVLLLDEPTSHLDLNHRLQVLDLVRELADGGLAVLVVFHDLDMAARYADRLAVVTGGAVMPAEVPERVITPDTLRAVFGVRAVVATDPVTGAVAVTPVLRDDAVRQGASHGRVFVVGGSGTGAALMRRLALAGWDVAAAALNAGDVDAGVADALGVEYPALPPFGAIDAHAAEASARLARESDVIVVCDVPFGGANLGNLEAIAEAGRPVVLVGSIDGRDFTGGRASALWKVLIQRGATTVARDTDVEAALAAIVEGKTE